MDAGTSRAYFENQMVTIKIPGMLDVKLTPIEFNLLANSLNLMIKWGSGGMFGDGSEITDKSNFERAKRIMNKLGYRT